MKRSRPVQLWYDPRPVCVGAVPDYGSLAYYTSAAWNGVSVPQIAGACEDIDDLELVFDISSQNDDADESDGAP